MKTLFVLLCSILWVPCAALAIEPIGTIGQPYPEKHAFLSDGTILRATWTHLQIVHPETGAVIDEFGELTYLGDIVFHPTADFLAVLNYDFDARTTRVVIWNLKPRRRVSAWDISNRIDAAAFSPRGTKFATGFDDEIHLWNWQTGERIGALAGERRPWKSCHSRGLGTTCTSAAQDNAMVFTPNGSHLIVVSTRPDVELWNVETHRLEGHLEGHTGNWVDDVAVSPNGEFLATVGRESDYVHVWHIETRSLLWKKRSGIGNFSGFIFSPDSQHLYVATETGGLHRSDGETWKGWDDRVRVWDVASGQQLDEFGTEFRLLEAFALSRNGKTALLYYWDAIVLWDIEAREQRKVWVDFVSRSFNLLQLTPDGRMLVCVTDYFIKIWDTASQQMLPLISAEAGLFRQFAISPDGQKLAVGRDPWIEVYNLHTGKLENQFTYYEGRADIAFSATGRWVAARDSFTAIRLFDVEHPEKVERAVPEGELDSWFKGIAFSENDEYLAAASDDGQILLWKRVGDAFAFQYSWPMEMALGAEEHFQFRQIDGLTVLAARGGGQFHIWQLTEHNPVLLATFAVESRAHLSADGRYLFAEQNNALQIWEWQTNTPIAHPPIPSYFAASQDGSVVLSYSETGQILIWNGRELLPAGAVAVEPRGKRIAIWGQVKQNQLLQNFPNPFNPETWIPFRLANESPVTIRIYAATGQLIRVLSPGILPSGDYSSPAQAVYWDGRNEIGEPVSSGVYLYTLHAGDFSATRKMLIRK